MLKTKPAPGGNREAGYGKALEGHNYSSSPARRKTKIARPGFLPPVSHETLRNGFRPIGEIATEIIRRLTMRKGSEARHD